MSNSLKRSQSYVKIFLKLIVAFWIVILVTNSYFLLTKPQLYNNQSNLYQKKAEAIKKGDYNTIILGTSRVWRGINPRHPAFQKNKAYNLGLSAAEIVYLEKALNFSRHHLPIENVLIGLDFESFTTLAFFNSYQDYITSEFYSPLFSHPILIYFKHLFSVKLFQKCTIDINSCSQDKIIKPHQLLQDNGFPLKSSSTEILNVRQKILEKLENDKKWLKSNLVSNGKNINLNPNQIASFRRILQICFQNNIKLYLFINPTHALYLDALDEMGGWEQFEQWKQEIVNIIVQESQKASLTKTLTLWDFSGYNRVTTEPLPKLNSTKPMRCFYDPSHYTPEVGNWIMSLVLNNTQNRENIPSDFGKIITPENINEHLQHIRQAQTKYRQSLFSSSSTILERR